MPVSSLPRAVVVMGVAGSGKSTVARAVADILEWRFCEGDDHHSSSSIAKMSSGEALTDDDRGPWLETLRKTIDASLAEGQSIVLACSALRADYRDQLIGGGEGMLVYLRGDRELIRNRTDGRLGHYMGSAMLESQFAALEEPSDVDAFIVDIAQDVNVVVGLIVAEIRSTLPTSVTGT